MSHLYEMDGYVEALADEACAETEEHKLETEALLKAIDDLDASYMLKQILRKLVERT